MKIFYTDQYDKKNGGRKQSREFLKKILCDCCGLSESVEILTDSRGMRSIDEHYGIRFSITHTGNFWFCAVSEKPCGIDAELQIRIVSRPDKLAARFLTEEEQEYVQLGNADGTASQRLLYLWTRKEAYLKYTGEGLYGLHDSPSVVGAPPGTSIRTVYGEHVCISICTGAVEECCQFEFINEQVLFKTEMETEA